MIKGSWQQALLGTEISFQVRVDPPWKCSFSGSMVVLPLDSRGNPSTSFIFYFYCCSSTVVSMFPLPTLTSHSQSYPSLALSMGPLYMVLDPSLSFPHYPPPPPLWLLLFVLYFNVSGSI